MTQTIQPNSCRCADCQSACKDRPGWFLPEQISPLAENLGLSVQELFDRHLMVDYWIGDNCSGNIYLLAPRILGHKGGTVYPSQPNGVCTWFKDGACSIHEAGKPFECAALVHLPNGEYTSADRQALAEAWDTPRHRAFIERLMGRDPDEAPFSRGVKEETDEESELCTDSASLTA